ncbi:MAG: transcription termination/antitermination protein NusG, partial [Acidimicrobiia bacterium]
MTTQPAESPEFEENADGEVDEVETDQIVANDDVVEDDVAPGAETVVDTEETAEAAIEETEEPAEAVEEATEVAEEPVEASAPPEAPTEETEEPAEAVEKDSPAAETEEPAEAAAPAEETEEPAEALKPASPYDLPGDWYVIHSYSGYENKVKANLETRIQSMHMEDRIFEVHIPMEDVVEFKGGKKVTVPKKVFPGYILVRMTLDDDSWYAVRNTPGVTGFVAGNAQKPTPLSRREVERFLGVQEEEEKGKPRFKPEWDVGEQVRVVTGPFADFNGVIEELNIDQQKVVVLVNIFGRDTPVELGFE